MKTTKPLNPDFVGQDFDEFLAQEGIAAEVEARAIKKVLVFMLTEMALTQAQLAEKLHTSRTQVRRLLDPDNTAITLASLQRAAEVAGHRLVVGFELRPSAQPSQTLASRHRNLRGAASAAAAKAAHV